MAGAEHPLWMRQERNSAKLTGHLTAGSHDIDLQNMNSEQN